MGTGSEVGAGTGSEVGSPAADTGSHAAAAKPPSAAEDELLDRPDFEDII